MRLSELVGIKKSSIHWDDATLVLLGKGNKERMVFLNDACLSALQVYLEVREESEVEKEREYLFLSKNKRPLSPRRVEQIVEDALKKAGLSGRGFSPPQTASHRRHPDVSAWRSGYPGSKRDFGP